MKIDREMTVVRRDQKLYESTSWTFMSEGGLIEVVVTFKRPTPAQADELKDLVCNDEVKFKIEWEKG